MRARKPQRARAARSRGSVARAPCMVGGAHSGGAGGEPCPGAPCSRKVVLRVCETRKGNGACFDTETCNGNRSRSAPKPFPDASGARRGGKHGGLAVDTVSAWPGLLSASHRSRHREAKIAPVRRQQVTVARNEPRTRRRTNGPTAHGTYPNASLRGYRWPSLEMFWEHGCLVALFEKIDHGLELGGDACLRLDVGRWS